MKIKKITALVIALAIMVSTVSVFAASNDATDTDYYTTSGELFAKVDNESATLKALPTANVDKTNLAGSSGNYILQEENGNKYQWLGRYYKKTANANTDATVYNKGTGTVFGETGEYVVEAKIQFTQTVDYGMGAFRFQYQTADSDKTLDFGMNVNAYDDEEESIYLKWDNGGSYYKKDLAKLALKTGEWYTFRNIFDLDNNTARMEIIDASGNVTSTGDVALYTGVSFKNMKFFRVRMDVGVETLSGFGIDDFSISKSVYVPVIDNQAAALKALPTNKVDTTNIAGTSGNYILQEENGNKYQWIGRFYEKTSNTNTDATVYNKGTGTVFGETGEYVLQKKIKFTQQENYSMGTYQIQYQDSSAQYTFAFRINNVNTLDDTAESIQFRLDKGSTNLAIKKDLASVALKADEWYTFRNIFNLDNNTARMEIVDASGNVTSTGNFALPSNLSSYANMTFYRVRFDVGVKTLSGFGIDDFTIAKTTHKPLVAEYDEAKGSVTLGGTKVSANRETPVPYNSASAVTLNVTAKEGYKVTDIIVNGQSMGADISDIQLTNVKSAQNVKVTFEENITTPSIGGSKADYIIAQPDYEGGYSFVAYYKIAVPSDCTLGSYGMYFGLKDGEPLKLTAKSAADGVFGVRVYGDAVNGENEYAFKGFANVSKSGEAETEYVSDEVVK